MSLSVTGAPGLCGACAVPSALRHPWGRQKGTKLWFALTGLLKLWQTGKASEAGALVREPVSCSVAQPSAHLHIKAVAAPCILRFQHSGPEVVCACRGCGSSPAA